MPRMTYEELIRNSAPAQKGRFRIGNFIAGFFLGPIGLLFSSQDESRKGSLSSTLIGWTSGWTLAILIVSAISFWNIRQEEATRARIVAERQAKQQEFLRQQEQQKEEEERAAILSRKRNALKIIKETRSEIDAIRSYINKLLAGEIQEGFDSVTIKRMGLPSGIGTTSIPSSTGKNLEETSSEEDLNNALSLLSKEKQRLEERKQELDSRLHEFQVKLREQEEAAERERDLARRQPCMNCNETGKKQCHQCNGKRKLEIADGVCENCSGKGIVTVMAKCDKCKGRGTVPGRKTCGNCRGQGYFKCQACRGWGSFDIPGRLARQRCGECNGRKKTACTSCDGKGYSSEPQTCPACRGSGEVESMRRCADCKGKGKALSTQDCSSCNGEGNEPCPKCLGKGFTYKDDVK